MGVVTFIVLNFKRTYFQRIVVSSSNFLLENDFNIFKKNPYIKLIYKMNASY